MAKTITTTVVLQGKDMLSPVVEKATVKSAKSLDTLQKKAQAISTGAFSVMRATAGIGTAIAAPLAYAGKQAVEFEHQLAQLGKVANMDLGSKGLTQLGEQAKEIAPYLATLPGDILQSMTALKQAGIPLNELKDVAKFVGEAGVAFDVTAGQAGEAFGSIRAAMNLTISEGKAAFDVINVLSNNMKATPERLLSFFTSGGAGVANALKLQSNEIAAYGATLIQAGKSGEEAATLIERVAKNIESKATLQNVFKKAGGGAKGLMSVLETGANLKDPALKSKYFKLFGEYSLEVRALADNMNGPNGLKQAIALVADESKNAGAVNREFTSVMKSTKNQIKQLGVEVGVLAIEAGDALLPILKELVNEAKPVVKQITEWIKANPELTKTIIKSAAGVAAFSFAVSGIAGVVGAAATTVNALSIAIGWFKTGGALAGVIKGVGALTTSMWALVAPALAVAGPYIAAGVALVGIGIAAKNAYDNIRPFHKLIITITTAIQTLIDKSGELFLAWAAGDYGKMWRVIKSGVTQTNDNVKAHMADWDKTHPQSQGPVLTPKRIQEIEDKRKVPVNGPDWLKNVEYNRKLRKDAEMRKLLNPQNLPGKPYYEPDARKLQPKPVNQQPVPKKGINWSNPLNFPERAPEPAPGPVFNPFRREEPVKPVPLGSLQSITINSSPVFNVQGPMTPELKKDLTGLLDENVSKTREMLQKAQRSQHRTSFDQVQP